MAIIRVYAGSDGKSHFEEIVPKFEPRGDKSANAELIPGSGIVIRRFDADRSNPWHHAPGRYAVFTLGGAVDTHHDQARFTWHLGPGGGEPIVIGFDVAVLNGGGQIGSVYGFLDKVPG